MKLRSFGAFLLGASALMAVLVPLGASAQVSANTAQQEQGGRTGDPGGTGGYFGKPVTLGYHPTTPPEPVYTVLHYPKGVPYQTVLIFPQDPGAHHLAATTGTDAIYNAQAQCQNPVDSQCQVEAHPHNVPDKSVVTKAGKLPVVIKMSAGLWGLDASGKQVELEPVYTEIKIIDNPGTDTAGQSQTSKIESGTVISQLRAR